MFVDRTNGPERTQGTVFLSTVCIGAPIVLLGYMSIGLTSAAPPGLTMPATVRTQITVHDG